jgi:hypothetical protein
VRSQERRRYISGTVNLDGSIQKGSGFSVQKAATGNYLIRFNNVSGIISCVISLIGNSGFCNFVVTGNTVNFVAQNYLANTNIDVPFNFVAECIAN